METMYYEKKLKKIVPDLTNEVEIDDKAYRTMYYNQKYIESLLKSNTKDHLLEILYDKGYGIQYDNTEKDNCYEEIKPIPPLELKEHIIKLLKLDEENLTTFEKELVSNDKLLEKHFNLRLLLKNKLNDIIIKSVNENLLVETFKNKSVKLKLCVELMNILGIEKLEQLAVDLTKNFKENLSEEKIKELNKVIKTIKYTFNIRTKKYDDFTYYNMYLLCIMILKQLLDGNMFKKKVKKIQTIRYAFYMFQEDVYKNHLKIIEKNNKDFFSYDTEEEDEQIDI